MQGLIAKRGSDTPGQMAAQASGSPDHLRPNEAAAVAGPAVFAEWLDAHGLSPCGPAERLDAVAAFAGLDRSLGWSGNLRRGGASRIAIRRGVRAWTRGDIACNEAAWREAAGVRADGCYDELVRAVADHLLCAGTRPDDTLRWFGDQADAWPFGALFIGATLLLRPDPFRLPPSDCDEG